MRNNEKRLRTWKELERWIKVCKKVKELTRTNKGQTARTSNDSEHDRRASIHNDEAK